MPRYGAIHLEYREEKYNRPQSEYVVDPWECELTCHLHYWQKIPIDMTDELTFLAADDMRTSAL
jgi:hypothetical protein